jgi:4-nitrophenyl phosphatase
MPGLLPPQIRALILDMDGVLWRADTPIGDLPDIFSRIHQLGLKVVLATNNSTRSVEQYVERLHGFGVEVEAWQIVTSSQAAAYLMRKHLPDGKQVYVIGENGLKQALLERGFEPVFDGEPASRLCAVVAGMDRQISYAKLQRATLLIRAGLPFYATNPDRTFPTPDGLVPGTGAILAAISAATDREPTVAGKPKPAMLDLAIERLGLNRNQVLMVGDRLETDIAGGQAAGCPTAVVLSGVSTREQVEAWRPQVEIVSPNLSALIGYP